MNHKELITQALQAREKAYAPYSAFKVGAALLAGDGTVLTGCNVENASFGLSICAERNALFAAVAAGKRDFLSLAVAAEGEPCLPCGACRQVLAEFNPDLEIIMANTAGDHQVASLRELLPGLFTFPGKHQGDGIHE